MNDAPLLSVVTPTYRRPAEAVGLLENLALQSVVPHEVVLVDGADDHLTEKAVRELTEVLPFRLRYVRGPRGTALQRNQGLELAQGDFVALIDDDVRLEPDFFARVLDEFGRPQHADVGGIVGYRTNVHFTSATAQRWRLYRRFRLLRTFEPGRYDFECGYPINNNLQPPFRGVREVDYMTTACAVWRRGVIDEGLRFDPFFADFGVLEDAHFSLRAGRHWRLLQCGDARAEELHAPGGRSDRRAIGFKVVVNYHYVFRSIAGPLSIAQRFRFWRFQAFELIRIFASAVRRRRSDDLREVAGRLRGIAAVLRGATNAARPADSH